MKPLRYLGKTTKPRAGRDEFVRPIKCFSKISRGSFILLSWDNKERFLANLIGRLF